MPRFASDRLRMEPIRYRVELEPRGRFRNSDGVAMDNHHAEIVRTNVGWTVQMSLPKVRIDGPGPALSFDSPEAALAALEAWVDLGMPDGVLFEGRMYGS